jgi:hypothetical protein
MSGRRSARVQSWAMGTSRTASGSWRNESSSLGGGRLGNRICRHTIRWYSISRRAMGLARSSLNASNAGSSKKKNE